MGISGLLPFVKKSVRNGNISELKGRSVAVDVSCLLHRGIFGCMDQIATGEDTNFYIYFVRKHIVALLELKCHVILVFDGRPLPAKKDTNAERRARREENLASGHVLLSQGKEEEASEMFKRATHITREVVENTIQFFRRPAFQNVDIIVAPYEADAQLAFLTREGLADAVITQDSDLIAFGCEKIIFKWDSATGNCQVYEKEKLPDCFPGPFKFTFEKFRRVCILTGCDYLQAGLPGVGLAKSLKFFTKTSQSDLRVLLRKVPSYLSMPSLKVSQEFIEDFIRAENTFLYQIVFDPRSRSQGPLNPYPIGGKEKENCDDVEIVDEEKSEPLSVAESLSYAGKIVPPILSVRLALGNWGEGSAMDDVFFLPNPMPDWSVWSGSFERGGARIEKREKEELKKKTSCGAFTLDAPVQRRLKMVPHSSKNEDDVIVLSTTSQPINTSASSDVPQPKRSFSLTTFFSAVSKTKEGTVKVSRASRVLRNEADQSWSVDEMMKMYSSQPTDSSRGSSISSSQNTVSSQGSSQESTDFTRKRSRQQSPSISEMDELFPLDGLSPIVTQSGSQELPAPSPSPLLSSTSSLSQPLSGLHTLSTSTPLREPVRSAYFMNRRSNGSNPFKKPRILASDACATPEQEQEAASTSVLNTANLESPRNSSFSGSFLDALSLAEGEKRECEDVREGEKTEKGDTEETLTTSERAVKKFGFRAAGLRRTSVKK